MGGFDMKGALTYEELREKIKHARIELTNLFISHDYKCHSLRGDVCVCQADDKNKRIGTALNFLSLE